MSILYESFNVTLLILSCQRFHESLLQTGVRPVGKLAGVVPVMVLLLITTWLCVVLHQVLPSLFLAVLNVFFSLIQVDSIACFQERRHRSHRISRCGCQCWCGCQRHSISYDSE